MQAEEFVNYLLEYKLSPITGVPCSVFKPLLNYLSVNSEKYGNYLCSSEGEALGLAAGFALSGKTPVVYMQNDGYGNAINPLSSLQLIYKLPVLMLISWRGRPGKKDAPQHAVMGETILSLLDVFEIPFVVVEKETDLALEMEKAQAYMAANLKPYALIVKKGYFEEYKIAVEDDNEIEADLSEELFYRTDFLNIINKRAKGQDVLLGATGFCGRELNQLSRHEGKFYMTGSMGCLASIGLGIALENPRRNVFVLDGDGALLMKMGTLSTVGFYQPANLIHICFDNGCYESTGGQITASENVDFSTIAKSCGYQSTISLTEPQELDSILADTKSFKMPLFLHIKIKQGTLNTLERPSDSPEDMKNNLMKFLKKEIK